MLKPLGNRTAGYLYTFSRQSTATEQTFTFVHPTGYIQA